MSGKLFGSSRQLGSFRGPILEEDEEEFLEAPPSTLTSRVKPRLGKGLSMLLHSSASSKHHTAKFLVMRPSKRYQARQAHEKVVFSREEAIRHKTEHPALGSPFEFEPDDASTQEGLSRTSSSANPGGSGRDFLHHGGSFSGAGKGGGGRQLAAPKERTMRECIESMRIATAAGGALGALGMTISPMATRAAGRILDGEPPMRFLARIPFFQQLVRERRVALVQQLQYKHEVYGAVLSREGQKVGDVILVFSGEVDVERDVIDEDGQSKTLLVGSCVRRGRRDGSGKHIARVRVEVGGHGSVYGLHACLFEVGAEETVTVASVRGAEILRLRISDVKAALDVGSIILLKDQVRDLVGWRQEHADRISATITRTVAGLKELTQSSRTASLIAFPSRAEMKVINAKARQDTWHPLGWRKNLALEQAGPSSSAGTSSAHNPALTSRPASGRSRPASALGLTRAASNSSEMSHPLSRPSSPHPGGRDADEMSDTRGRSSGSGGGRGAEAGPRASPMVEAGPSRREGDRPGSAQGVGRRPERPASALPFRPRSSLSTRGGDRDRARPHSATPGGRDEASTSGNLFAPPPEIHQRQLFLNTWLPPEAHTVAVGSFISAAGYDLDMANQHVELNIDEIDLLD